MRKENIFGGMLILLLICVFFVGNGSAADDPIVGTWSGDAWVFLAGYNVDLVCYEDHTAQLTGDVNAFGYESSVNEPNLTWKNDGNGQYTGAGYGSHSLSLYLNGDTLSATVNLYELGVLDSSIANRDITVYLYNTPPANILVYLSRNAIQLAGFAGING